MHKEMNHYMEWSGTLEHYEKLLTASPERKWSELPNGQALRMAIGLYKLKCFAERILSNPAATWAHMEWQDAIRLHLVNKHHWPLEQVRQLKTEDDFLFLMHDELLEMKLTEQEAYPVRQWTDHLGSREEFRCHFAGPAQ